MIRCMLSYSTFTRPTISQLYQDFPEFTLLPSREEGVQTEHQPLDILSKSIIHYTNDKSVQTQSLDDPEETRVIYCNN